MPMLLMWVLLIRVKDIVVGIARVLHRIFPGLFTISIPLLDTTATTTTVAAVAGRSVKLRCVPRAVKER